MYIHTLTHSLWSLFISFVFRYLILYKVSLKEKHILLALFVFYIPSFVQAVGGFCVKKKIKQKKFQATYWTSFVDSSTILPITKRIYPQYNFELETGLITGITNLFSVSAIYAVLHMTIPVTPVYITIFILRRKILKTLMMSYNVMSKETKAIHAQLMKVSILTLNVISCFDFRH